MWSFDADNSANSCANNRNYCKFAHVCQRVLENISAIVVGIFDTVSKTLPWPLVLYSDPLLYGGQKPIPGRHPQKDQNRHLQEFSYEHPQSLLIIACWDTDLSHFGWGHGQHTTDFHKFSVKL